MPLVVPDIGELFLLEMIRSGLNAVATYKLRLYKNNYTPVQGTIFADFTEADFSGYTTPSFADWGAASTVSNKAKIVCASAKVISHDGGGTANTVYGYWYTSVSGTQLIYAERFASPIVMAALGDIISITPAFTLNSEN